MMSSNEQMDVSFDANFKEDGGGGGGFFRDLTCHLENMLAKPCTELDADHLNELNSYLRQTNEAMQNGQIDDEPSAVNEIFSISAMSAKLCLGFDDVKSEDAILAQLKDVFYLANELFSGAISLCSSRNFTITQLGEILNYVKCCQKLDVKLFLQASKTFLSVIDKKRAIDFAEFLQSVIFSDFLAPSKRSQTAVKVTGFVLRNLSALYTNHGPVILSQPTSLRKAAQFLIDLHAVYWEFLKVTPQSEAETLTNAFNQFVTPSFQAIFQPLLRHESFLSTLTEFDFSELTSSSKTAWLCLVVNIFAVMGDSKTISQTNNVLELLEAFLRNFCEWACDETSSQQWPWPVFGPSSSSKAQSAHELCAFSIAKLVLRSTLEEASSFFAFEQLLLLALTGKSPAKQPYPILACILISDSLTFITKSSPRLAIRYVSILGEFVAKTAENEEPVAFLVPALLRRIFDTLADDQKSKFVEQALDELVRSFPSLVTNSTSSSSKRQSSGVYSMTEAFRMLEACTNALLLGKLSNNGQVVPLLTVTVRLFAYLTWWTASSPDMLKSCKNYLEKITFSMWQILSMTVQSTQSSHSLLVLFAQAVFEASKTAIIGIGANNYENGAKFWSAAGQFVEIASLPASLKQLFVAWLLKVADSTTLACSPGAQKVLENCLLSDDGGDNQPASLLHGVVLANLASRLNLKGGNTASILAAKLNPKLRVQAEAFSQQLFCIPFSKLS